jgi:hypothetical protein
MKQSDADAVRLAYLRSEVKDLYYFITEVQEKLQGIVEDMECYKSGRDENEGTDPLLGEPICKRCGHGFHSHIPECDCCHSCDQFREIY